MARALLLLALALSSTACSRSKEEQICRKHEQWIHDKVRELGDTPTPWTTAKLDACVAEQKQYKQMLALDEAGYQALLDCFLAATVEEDLVECASAPMKKAMGAATRDLAPKAAAEAKPTS